MKTKSATIKGYRRETQNDIHQSTRIIVYHNNIVVISMVFQ